MNESHVVKIIDSHVKSGYSEKTHKEWSMSLVELDNGQQARIFNPVREGDRVMGKEVTTDKGTFMNWSVVTAQKAEQAELLATLKRVEAKIDRLLGEESSTTAPTTNARPAASTAATGYTEADDPYFPLPEGF